jgi:hypothetical protein
LPPEPFIAGIATVVKFIYCCGQRQQREKVYREKVAADIADLQRSAET